MTRRRAALGLNGGRLPGLVVDERGMFKVPGERGRWSKTPPLRVERREWEMDEAAYSAYLWARNGLRAAGLKGADVVRTKGQGEATRARVQAALTTVLQERPNLPRRKWASATRARMEADGQRAPVNIWRYL